jgi:hypothetical protein
MRGPSRNYDAWALSSSLVSLHFLSDGMADPDTYGNPERDIEQVSFIIRLIFFFSVKINYMVLDFCFRIFILFFIALSYCLFLSYVAVTLQIEDVFVSYVCGCQTLHWHVIAFNHFHVFKLLYVSMLILCLVFVLVLHRFQVIVHFSIGIIIL